MERAGTREFLDAVIGALGQPLLRYFAARVPDPSEAQDLVQEVYLRLLKLERPDLIRSLQAYVYSVAGSVVFEHLQRRSLRPVHIALEDMPADALLVEAEAVESLECADQLATLLGRLPANLQAALIWAHRDGHTYQEISERLCVPRHRVKKYLAKALAHCRSGMTLEAATS